MLSRKSVFRCIRISLSSTRFKTITYYDSAQNFITTFLEFDSVQ